MMPDHAELGILKLSVCIYIGASCSFQFKVKPTKLLQARGML